MIRREPYQRLLQIEDSIAIPDRQRLMILDTSYLALQTLIREHWKDLKQIYAISEMIARRMFYYYRTQKQLKKVFQISMAAASSDVLEQAIGMYLSAYLGQFEGFEVKMNSLFKHRGGQIRPDIAVLKDKTKLATVEIKIDLGWQRNYLKTDWEKRCEECKTAGFRRSYIFMLTKYNWEKEYEEIRLKMENDHIFVLLKEHPNNDNRFPWYKNDTVPLQKSDIISPIEIMFEEILRIRNS